jgi:prepilin signal peptidase PulO-like enzyme (type II secretory pathway)
LDESLIESWISLPIGLRLGLLAVVGGGLGAVANHLIYRYAWYPRLIGPWGQPHADADGRRWGDRVPILGWWGLRRESSIHGRGYWLRPMLIEAAMAVGVPALYWYETQSGRLLPPGGPGEVWATILFVSHLVMVSLMVAATFIDFDEQTIPDVLTVPGTLIALGLASLSMQVFMPATDPETGLTMPTTFYLPGELDPKWLGPQGWWAGIGLWTAWCFALSNRRVIMRRGPLKAVEYFVASLFRYPSWKYLLGMWGVGFFVIRSLFSVGGATWIGLLTALVGMGVGGGVVWAIRIVGSLAMRREALGFGDVTLMAMVGAFIGWQGAVMSFFLSPIAAIAIVLLYFLVTRNSEIPFGPYLCAGTLLTLFGWNRLVDGWFLNNLAVLGPFMLWLFIALTGIMGVMLYFWRMIKESFLGE